MAQPNTINPYPSIGAEIASGLNAIIAATPTTIPELVAAVDSYISSVYYTSATTQVHTEIQTVAYNVINSYRNSLVLSGEAMYNATQAPFLQMLIGIGMTANMTPDSIVDRIADIEDNVGTSELNINEQQPLFLATIIGTNANAYWLNQLAGGNASSWFSFFATNAGQNYMNTLQWTVAAMNGALAGYGATPGSLIEPTVNMVTNNMVSALIGALTATAGKVMFNWIPRITKPIPSAQSISDFRNQYVDVMSIPNDGNNPINNGFLWWGKGTNDQFATMQKSTGCADTRTDNRITIVAC